MRLRIEIQKEYIPKKNKKTKEDQKYNNTIAESAKSRLKMIRCL